MALSVLADTSDIPDSRSGPVERTEARQATLKFAEAALADSKREGLLLAVRARWVALAVTAVTLPIINPNWEVLYYVVMLGLFALIGWAQLKVGKTAGRSRPELFLIFCDLALLTFLSVVPNPWSTVNWPLAMQFRFDSFIYFFIFLATATMAYSWRTVVAMGVWTSALWVVAVIWVYLQPETHAALSERVQGRHRLRHQAVRDHRSRRDRLRRPVSANHRLPDRRHDPGAGGAPFQCAADQPRRDRARAHQPRALFFAQRRRGAFEKRRAAEAGSNPGCRGAVRRYRRLYRLFRRPQPDRGDRHAAALP